MKTKPLFVGLSILTLSIVGLTSFKMKQKAPNGTEMNADPVAKFSKLKIVEYGELQSKNC